MHIAVIVDPGAVSVWQVAVVEDLRAIPRAKVTVHAGPRRPLPAALQLLLDLERTVLPLPAGHPTTPSVSLGELDPGRPRADLAVDLTGAAPAEGAPIVLRPLCDGRPLVEGGALAIVDGRSPVLELVETAEGRVDRLARYAVAVEDRQSVLRGLEGLIGRARQTLQIAVADRAAGRPPQLPKGTDGTAAVRRRGPLAARTAGFLARGVLDRVRIRLQRLLKSAPNWQVAWRPAATADGSLPDFGAAPFRTIASDGQRFYADPFLWQRGGRTVLFVEEFPFATGKGILSVCEIDGEGPRNTPRPILELDCHTSYPYLLEHQGELYMIPETSGRGTVELWRCTRFPDRFEPMAVLISGRDLSDATVFQRGGTWHLLAASRGRWCSSWDALDHWTAPALTGPWRRTGEAPVAIDAASLRPAGRPFAVGEALYRPVQDCSARYGGALALARIDALGPDGPEESIVRRISPPRPCSGLHAYDRAAGLEVVDLFGPLRAAEVRIR